MEDNLIIYSKYFLQLIHPWFNAGASIVKTELLNIFCLEYLDSTAHPYIHFTGVKTTADALEMLYEDSRKQADNIFLYNCIWFKRFFPYIVIIKPCGFDNWNIWEAQQDARDVLTKTGRDPDNPPIDRHPREMVILPSQDHELSILK
jgi:hypothetical protein